jgi:hypothetical protein
LLVNHKLRKTTKKREDPQKSAKDGIKRLFVAFDGKYIPKSIDLYPEMDYNDIVNRNSVNGTAALVRAELFHA